ncbi:MAG TPA: cytochrome c peroxidase [Fibrobacteria bacterium]|nr:cytochrome c peroxidase [Fibrobacteria bacterium]
MAGSKSIAAVFLVASSAFFGFAEGIGVPDPASIEYPDGKPPSQAEVELGKTLFFDNRLSMNRRQSCASCHNPDLGFGDGMSKGHGTMGRGLDRNTPSIYNLAWNSVFFWDGRASSLEEQALGPIQSPGEMNMPIDSLLARLKKVAYYKAAFERIYGRNGTTGENLGKAVAAFERTLISKGSPFDKYMQGDKSAMGPEASRGMALFQGKAGCIACHSGPNFTDESFHNIGLGDGDVGRAKIMTGATLTGAFKTPGLRNVALNPPYMHDGSEASLESVVRYYNKGGNTAEARDKLIRPLKLNDAEVQELVSFLGSLTDPVKVVPPRIPKDD